MMQAKEMSEGSIRPELAIGHQDELDKIVNEIQELQQEMAAAVPPAVVTQSESVVTQESREEAFLKEFGDPNLDESLEATQVDLDTQELPSGGGPLDQIMESVDPVKTQTPVNSPNAAVSSEKLVSTPSPASSIAMTLQGKINLKLNYNSSDQQIVLDFDEEQIHIHFWNGVEFKFPLQR